MAAVFIYGMSWTSASPAKAVKALDGLDVAAPVEGIARCMGGEVSRSVPALWRARAFVDQPSLGVSANLTAERFRPWRTRLTLTQPATQPVR
ncbi:hypothetical protein [Streptomyces bobili]|uniref:hypothetical protein n=1 Tax=Streptomyces bobili TaxID=67280 RepID=UPI00379E6249